MFVVKQESQNKPKFVIKNEIKGTPTVNIGITLKKSINPQPLIAVPSESTLTMSSPCSIPQSTSQQLPLNKQQPTIIPFKNRKIRFRLSVIKDSIADRKNKKSKETKMKTRKQGRDDKFSSGRWKVDEHQRFVEAIIKFGNDWKQVQKYVRTRSSTQARSHAQKFFMKIKKAKILKFNLDLSKNSIKMLHDLLNELSKEEYQRIIYLLNTVAFERNNFIKKKLNKMDSYDSVSDSSSFSEGKKEKKEEDIDIVENFGIMDNIDNRPDIKYILNGFINTISNEELYGPDQQLSTNKYNSMNNASNLGFDLSLNRRGMSIDIDEVYLNKRASINSMEGFFKNCIDDKDIKNLNLGMNTDKMHLIDFNDNNFISNTNNRKVSNDEELLLSYLKSNMNKL